MKNSFNNNPDLFISAVLFLITMVGFAACYESPTEEQIKESEVRRERNCHSKYSGSAPRCWTKSDWKAYCEHVQCKR